MKNYHDLPIEEQKIARSYVELINITSFMKRDSVKKFGEELPSAADLKTISVTDDKYLQDIIAARTTIINMIDEMIGDTESNLYKYSAYSDSFSSDFTDMADLKNKFETLSDLYLSILKERWDETDPASSTPKITQIVSMDNRLVYIINSISSIGRNLEYLSRHI